MKTSEGALFLLVDQSGSMNDFTDTFIGDKQERVKKIDYVQGNLQPWLDKNDDVTVHCYGFSDKVEKKFSWNPSGPKIPRVVFECMGGSQIWDSIDYVLGQIPANSSSSLVCITDGKDSSRSNTCAQVIQRAKIKEIALEIILVENESIHTVEEFVADTPIFSDQSIVLKQLSSFEAILNKAASALKPRIDQNDISVTVLPLVKTESADIFMLQRVVRQAVSYLEDLTQFRYYPVPTLIVDEITIREIKLSEETEIRPPRNECYDLVELYRFVRSVCLTFHTGAFDGVDLLGNDHYGSYSNLPDEARLELRRLCEICACELGFLLHERGCPGEWRCQSESQASIKEVKKRLNQVLHILTEGAKAHPNAVSLHGGYFKTGSEAGEDVELLPDLDVWNRYLGKKDRERIHRCVTGGYWKKDIESIVEAFQISLYIIFFILNKSGQTSHPARPLARNLHLYGTYIWQNQQQHPMLDDLLRSSGFPAWFQLSACGYIVICLETIKQEFDNLQTSSSQMTAWLSLEELVTAVIVHEHTHAVISEGIRSATCSSFDLQQFANDQNFITLNESLAEWSELNFFRGNKIMTEVVSMHSKSGEFPAWPYRGAFFLENEFQKSPDYVYFRTLLAWMGKNIDKAYNLLINF